MNPVTTQISELEKEIYFANEKLMKLKAELPGEKVNDYELKNLSSKTVMLSELFGDKEELLLVHHMGPGCPYCTL